MDPVFCCRMLCVRAAFAAEPTANARRASASATEQACLQQPVVAGRRQGCWLMTASDRSGPKASRVTHGPLVLILARGSDGRPAIKGRAELGSLWSGRWGVHAESGPLGRLGESNVVRHQRVYIEPDSRCEVESI